MAEPSTAYEIPLPSGSPDQLPRCCPRHDTWATLSEHLLEEFPEVALGDLVRELRRAKEAVDHVGLPHAEALAIGELIARHQLMVRSGRLPEVARLDPERHVRAGE